MAKLDHAMRVLARLSMLPLEELTEHAPSWRADIARAIEDLDETPRLPKNDPLRFDAEGKRLTEEQLHAKLDMIIESWPSWEEEKKRHARETSYPKYRPKTYEVRRG